MTDHTSVIKDEARRQLKDMRDTANMVSRLEAFRSVFERAGRILSGMMIRVIWAMGGNIPPSLSNNAGWTDGETIFLNSKVFNRDLGTQPLNMIVLHSKAVFLHELGHDMISPRLNSDICKWVIQLKEQSNDSRWWYSMNALEDQRMEMLFTAMFRPAGPYFETIVLKWLVNRQAFLAEAFILVYGRKFLPSSLVQSTRDAFVAKYSEALAVEFEEVIDDYLKVTYPVHSMKAQKCVTRFYKAMQSMYAMHPHGQGPTPDLPSADNGGITGPDGSNDATSVKKGSPSKKAQDQAQKNVDTVGPRQPKPVDDDIDDEDEDSDDDSEADDFGDEGEDGSGGSDKGDLVDSDDRKVGGGSPEDGADGEDGDDDADSASSGGTGGGVSSDTSAVSPTQTVMDEVDKAMQELFEDEDFLKELNSTTDAIRDAMNGEGVAVGEHLDHKMVQVSPDTVMAARRMGDQLTRLRMEMEEEYLRRQTSGKLDLRRFMTRQPWEFDVFTQYDPGLEEQADVEAVILIDLSGSMSSQMALVSESLWTVKRAFEALESRVTVLGYSERSFVLYQPTERVGKAHMKLFASRGSTVPDAALKEAVRLFRLSERSQKILVSISDGMWGGNRQTHDSCLASMHEDGVTSCFINLGYGSDKRGHEIGHTLKNINEMPKVAIDIVAAQLKRMIASSNQSGR